MDAQHTSLDISEINAKIERESAFVDILTSEMNKVIVGQKQMIERLCFFRSAHCAMGRHFAMGGGAWRFLLKKAPSPPMARIALGYVGVFLQKRKA